MFLFHSIPLITFSNICIATKMHNCKSQCSENCSDVCIFGLSYFREFDFVVVYYQINASYVFRFYEVIRPNYVGALHFGATHFGTMPPHTRLRPFHTNICHTTSGNVTYNTRPICNRLFYVDALC